MAQNNQHSVIADLNTLTTIPEKSLNKFFRKINACICESIAEDILQDAGSITEVNIGIGILYIKHDGAEIKYHFKPSEALNTAVIGTIDEGKNPLSDILTEALATKFTDLYKDLC